ncbi:MAG: NFACT family protein [Armatimonadetes bacterium]|nr:NFACT family protein [Armatimonadota bacterium]
MDSLCLTALADDLSRRLVGRRLGGVVVPRREQVCLGVPDGALLISIAAADARVHLIDRMPPDPHPEPSIQTHLDSILRAAEVRSVTAVSFDRVLRIEVSGMDRVGNPHDYSLVIELMGKHSAFVVLDGGGLIVATLKTVTRSVNRHRELLARLPYVPPPGGDRRDPLTLTPAEWDTLWPELATYPSLREGWRAKLFGLSNELWAWLQAHGAEDGREGAWQALAALQAVVRDSRWQPCLLRNADGIPADAWPLPLPNSEPVANLHAALALVASQAGERGRLRVRRGELLGMAERRLHRIDSQIKGLDRAADRAAQADTWQHWADLLLANLHLIKPRAEQVTVVDWDAEGADLNIELDPQSNGPKNAEALYERARRARRAVEETPGRRPELAAEADRLHAVIAALKAAETTDELDDLADEHEALLADGAAPERLAKPKTERERWLRRLEKRTSSDGYTILIGRNSQESEGLLSRCASPSDLWFHVRGAGSGHVIVRTNGQPDLVPPKTIEDAARWAARCSKMKHSSLVPVVYTQRKYVTKVTGGAAGKVVYRHEKSIFIEP